ncbi:Putative transposase/recombinase [Neorhizobium galegae bv. officinalis]|uniref:Putative transposase/recombinase n=1 Tax=Neorhizobium galegae bv. officinalis TaxID=323656 RepID=A0A0T7FAY2_NEOGA|nr:DDE-type integrase/transposase/recombinase [Neorhizobium galegae]CDZ32178.1 Putative transposase/recombinase [Neorhizobium galegae bv. officinalis]
MKEWLTAREIAAETLPDMPNTERGVQLVAERGAWDTHPTYARSRKGRGGGLEFHYRLLPTLAQIAYVQKHMTVGAEPVEPKTIIVDAPIIAGKAGEERDARLAIMAAFETFSRGLRLNKQACIAVFCDKYQMGSVKVDAWVKERIPTVGRRTLWRWLSVKACGKIEALAVDRSKARAGKGILETAYNGAVKAFILAWIATNPALAADAIRGYVEDEYGKELLDANGELKELPPLRTFQHFIKGLKASEKVVLTAITNPDKYRSTMKLRGTGSYQWITRANELWMIDASPGDAMLIDGRHSIYVCIDVATRWMTITVTKTPRASAVGLLMRKAILRSGICSTVKTDNGSDFVARDTQRLFTALDITAERSEAFTPEEKAFVERAIKTVQHSFFTQLPGYIGHNVSERKAIEERKSFAQRLGDVEIETFSASVTAEQLQQQLDDWLEYKYHHDQHGGLFGKTPAQAVAEKTDVIRRVDERALDVLLMPVAGKDGMRRMTAQGIKIDENYYICSSILPGTDVFVRLDPIDMGKVYVFDLKDGRFIDEAICPKLSNINRPAFVKAKKQEFNAMVADRTRGIKADVRALQKGPSGIERTIRLAKKKSAEREEQNANVIPMPRREEPHSTPQISAALDAISSADRPATFELTAAQMEMHARIERELGLQPLTAPEGATPIRKEETPQQRFQRWFDIDQRYRAGEPVDGELLIALGEYKAGVEWKVQMGMRETFGDQAPVLRT